MLSRLLSGVQHRKEDFSFILGGILGILEEHAAIANNILPGSKKPVPYILETCESGPRGSGAEQISHVAMADSRYEQGLEYLDWRAALMVEFSAFVITSLNQERLPMSSVISCSPASSSRMTRVRGFLHSSMAV